MEGAAPGAPAHDAGTSATSRKPSTRAGSHLSSTPFMGSTRLFSEGPWAFLAKPFLSVSWDLTLEPHATSPRQKDFPSLEISYAAASPEQTPTEKTAAFGGHGGPRRRGPEATSRPVLDSSDSLSFQGTDDMLVDVDGHRRAGQFCALALFPSRRIGPIARKCPADLPEPPALAPFCVEYETRAHGVAGQHPSIDDHQTRPAWVTSPAPDAAPTRVAGSARGQERSH
ncbi:hypothetical protein Purlil1_1793 [Purpureocillium lilacinum]|uniref:Uncharacterized protein n=1 Tax=Purpureocillium lilacinum TaxID=33203 RepID=A0ABR0CB93_PURLI|nr:hypothetical protein Purlil1_1793 [Purpureocillium lilacinum]